MSIKHRKQARDIDIASESLTVKTESSTVKKAARKAKTFVPDQTGAFDDVPESITAGERLPHISEYSGISLEAIPVKGLKSFIVGFGCLLLVLVGWEAFSVFQFALDMHWLFASGFVALLAVVLGLGGRLLRSYLYDKENLSALAHIQQQAGRLSDAHDIGNAKLFIKELKRFYDEKPQAVYFQRCIEVLPDYSNDREVINHIEAVFLQPLDKEAQRRISNYSLQTGAAVAVSPWASLDMLLSLWRSIKMIDDVAQVYGMRPSITNRYKLLKLVIHQLAFVGATEIVIDQVMDEFGSSTLTSMASVRLGQGLGAGIYTARIGVAAMKVSRPIAFSKDTQPKTKSIIKSMIENLKGMMVRRKL